VAGHRSSYEHQVIRQFQNRDALSTTRLFEMANDRGTYHDVFTATNSNWSSLQAQLVNWSTAQKDQVTNYLNAGFTVDLPQYGDLAEDNWTGMGFCARSSSSSLLTAAYLVSVSRIG
jgi:hypothetical protein